MGLMTKKLRVEIDTNEKPIRHIVMGDALQHWTKSTINFQYPDTRMDVDVMRYDKSKPTAVMIKLYGVSKETFDRIKVTKRGEYEKACHMSLYYTQMDEQENKLMEFMVDRIMYAHDGGRQVVTIIGSDNLNTFVNKQISVNIKKPGLLTSAVSEVATQMNFKTDFDSFVSTIQVGKVATHGNVDKVLRDILPSRKVEYFIKYGTIFVHDIKKTLAISRDVWLGGDLLNLPIEDTKDEFQMLTLKFGTDIDIGSILQYRGDKNVGVTADMGISNRKYKVINYKMNFSDGQGSITAKCQKL